ncbi:MAG: RNA polymerase sigma factor [Bacteroidaceae bacterium]|nr:RNA polymerase sigma factor [Bacteroidaceae bacterium]
MQEIDFRTVLLPLKDQLFRLALRITLDRAEAEDIVQDTLLRVWERRTELAGVVNSLEAYCLTVCRNLALDRKERKEAQNLSLEEGDRDAVDNAFSPQEQIERDERLQRVHRLFNQLPERQRSIIQLRDIEGKSYKEIAMVLGLTEDVVKVTLFRARQRIRQQYEKIDAYGL